MNAIKLVIVYDRHSFQEAIYIGGKLRGQWYDEELKPSDIVECYETFARDQPVIIERAELNSDAVGLWDDEDAEVNWPEEFWKLEVPNA